MNTRIAQLRGHKLNAPLDPLPWKCDGHRGTRIQCAPGRDTNQFHYDDEFKPREGYAQNPEAYGL